MIRKYFAHYREFEKGRYGFVTDIALFVLITYFFHLLFRYFAADIMSVPAIIASGNWLAHVVFLVSLWINEHFLGMQVATEPVNTMWFLNKYGLTVNSSCSGLKQFYQVLVLFVLFPGPWRHKLWFIPFSCFIMFITNVFRIVMLSIVQSWRPEYFSFTHTWVLRPFFYVILFILWIWWVEKFKRSALEKG